MMDEMRFKLSTNFMKNIVAKLLARFIYKKTGYKVEIQLDEIDIWALNGNTTAKLNMEVKLKSDEFNKIMKSINLE